MRTCIVDLTSALVENIVDMGAASGGENYQEATTPPIGKEWIAHATAQIGWKKVGGVLTDLSFKPDPVDVARVQAIETTMGAATYGVIQPATRDQLKAFDNAAYSAWFDANFTTNAQLVALLKLLTRLMIRRVL